MRLPAVPLLATILAVSLVSAAAPKDARHKVKESISPPRGWVKHARPPSDHIIELRIGLPQPNFHVLEDHLYEISDPSHERYGAHLSKEEVEELVAPDSESIELVDEWLGSYGISETDLVRSPAKDWVTIKIPVDLAEKMLDSASTFILLHFHSIY